MSEAEVYDRTATRWARTQPTSLSDFTGRPAVFELCGEVKGMSVLDLGCGEGYCSRILMERGAGHVVGVDAAQQMIRIAQEQEDRAPLGIEYRCADATQPAATGGIYDLICAVFLFNYLTVREMELVMRRIHESLVPGGRFVFSVPHPAFTFIHSETPPFYFQRGELGYFGARDRRHAGRIDRLDGTQLEVAAYHKTFEDYFCALAGAGFESMPAVRELGVTAEHLALNPEFFGPIADVPLHAAFRVTKSEFSQDPVYP